MSWADSTEEVAEMVKSSWSEAGRVATDDRRMTNVLSDEF